MLGAVKGDDDVEGVPLFRVLARRWKSFAPPVKRERVSLSSMQSAEEQAPPARAWISKPRQIYAHHKVEPPKPARGWNPWLWIK